jgi:hypothetical protein
MKGGKKLRSILILYILYIKAKMVSVRLSVRVDKNWAVPGRIFQALLVHILIQTRGGGQ